MCVQKLFFFSVAHVLPPGLMRTWRDAMITQLETSCKCFSTDLDALQLFFYTEAQKRKQKESQSFLFYTGNPDTINLQLNDLLFSKAEILVW